MRFLPGRGADLHDEHEPGATALCDAAKEGYKSIVEFFVGHGANADCANGAVNSMLNTTVRGQDHVVMVSHNL